MVGGWGAIPEAHILFDLFTMAPLRIIPSVWPVASWSSLARVTVTLPGMIIGRMSLRRGSREVIDRKAGQNLEVMPYILGCLALVVTP